MKSGIAILAITLLAPADSTAADIPTVTSRASVEVKMKPDTVFVSLVVSANGVLVSDAETNAKETVKKLTAAVEKDFKKVSLSVFDLKTGAKSVGWRTDGGDPAQRPEVSKRLLLSAPYGSIDPAALVDLALRNGASFRDDSRYVGDPNSSVYYGLKDATEAEKKAEKLAFEKATEQAKSLAALAGKTLGALQGIEKTCGSGESWRPDSDELPVKYKSVSAEDLTVTASVEVEYELK